MRYDGTLLKWMIPNLKAKLGTRLIMGWGRPPEQEEIQLFDWSY
jgi:hypothetical protein